MVVLPPSNESISYMIDESLTTDAATISHTLLITARSRLTRSRGKTVQQFQNRTARALQLPCKPDVVAKKPEPSDKDRSAALALGHADNPMEVPKIE
jgi:hypothetical protein